jgi:hypothetical protein
MGQSPLPKQYEAIAKPGESSQRSVSIVDRGSFAGAAPVRRSLFVLAKPWSVNWRSRKQLALRRQGSSLRKKVAAPRERVGKLTSTIPG